MEEDDSDSSSRSCNNRRIQSLSQPLTHDASIHYTKRHTAAIPSLDASSHNLLIRYPNPNLPPPVPPDGGSSSALLLDLVPQFFGAAAPDTLPEFVGAGGGAGIFRVPQRAALHPGRPPALELRPHPLRETQYGSFLRKICCTDGQIWAGQECGLRFWKYDEVFSARKGGVRVKRGDEESAPFKETGRCAPTLCLVVDVASGVVWSGHKDGKIRSWKIEEDREKSVNPLWEEEVGEEYAGGEFQLKEGLSWQAHRTSVLSMIISSYGNSSDSFVQFFLLIKPS